MAEKDGFVENVGFLYRTMVERDPSKRRVKPVENHLQLLDFADLGDSSDDSDFHIDDHEKDLESDDQGDSSENNDDDDVDGTSEEESEDANIQQSIQDGVEETKAAPLETKKVPKIIVGDLIERAMQRQSQARQRISSGESSFKFKVSICSVCLGDISIEDDEIVECDCCGVSVHEGCYGISDTDTVLSSVSSSSTEPWFCDPCKAGQKDPVCELCPNTGGIFKETEVGKWVHLVCALYIPGVAFGNVEKLTPVTLFEMPYSRWGAKPCSLCEDDRLSRTGVCICCDAGMCKTYFHVTCAQREGLLSEASMEEIADPFFAYCKVHADKMIVRSKRRNWLALQSRKKERMYEVKEDPKEQSRVERKLEWHREKYRKNKTERPPPWVPTQKMPRLLTSSASACRKLLRKAELLGVSPQAHLAAESIADVHRKWHVPPAFSLEFVSYYVDRCSRVATMQRRLDELLQQNAQYQEEEQQLRNKYEALVKELEELKKENSQLQEAGVNLWNILCDLGTEKLPWPDILEAKKPAAKPASRTNRRSDSGSSFLFECGVCKGSQDQHQLARCDSCQLHYHLYCLDPPLTRMPKKTKSMGWQCSECDKNADDEKERHCDLDAPRRLRDFPRGTVRYEGIPYCIEDKKPSRMSRRVRQSSTPVEPMEEDSSSASTPEKQRKLSTGGASSKKRKRSLDAQAYKKSKRSKRRKVSASTNGTTGIKIQDAVVQEPPPVVPTEENEIQVKEEDKSLQPDKEVKAECVTCGTPGDSSSLVICDACNKGYHFLCLHPPVKKSPKQRGYTWHCEDCTAFLV
ncbi:PHD finger protein 14-like [Ornithodoros turicata]|uniref:PHD finger protein 14-like n=1 Tax=Ornithodoros turicata TaxID=34597 RepID=UPI0031391678